MATIINHYFLPLFFFFFFVIIHHCFIPVFSSSSSSNSSLLLQDVLKEITANQKWEFQDIKVSRLDLQRFRFVSNRRYEFRVGLGSIPLSVQLSKDVLPWNKFRKPRTDFESLVDQVRSFAFLETFKVKGPFELRIVGDDNDNPSLLLPMNRTYNGIKRILVGESITVEVIKAKEVLAFQESDLSSTGNGSRNTANKKGEFSPISRSFCRALVQIQVSGSAEFKAYETRNPENYVKSSRISKETIRLLSDKCSGNSVYKKRRCPVDSLSLRISLLEEVLKRYFGKSVDSFLARTLIRGKITASVSVRFQLELEREFGGNFTRQEDFGWRTRPEIERVWFDVLASVEQDSKLLKLLVAKKIKSPFIADTVLWSTYLSNTSFTKFPSLLVPSEALTLDIKW